jgi:hypothetical protein
MPNRNQPHLLSEISMMKVRDIISRVALRWIEGLQRAIQMGPETWYQRLECVQQESHELRAVLTEIPNTLAEQMIRYLVKRFSQLISRYYFNIRPKSVRTELLDKSNTVCLSIIRVILLPCIRKFDIIDITCCYTQSLFFQSIFCFSKITCLKISIKTHTDVSSSLVRNISYLSSLIEFEYVFDCTDELIKEMSLHCGRMKKLRLRYCYRVSAECVTHLINLKELKTVDLTGTSVTDDGYAMLLQGLPKLIHVVWGSTLDEVLEKVTKERTEKVMCCHSFINSAALLVQKCPNIRILTLLQVEDLTPLRELTQLVRLNIRDFDYAKSNATTVLQAIGHRLEEVTLNQVSKLSIEDVISYCTAAETLNLIHCKFSAIKDFTKVFCPTLPHFQSVKNLQWVRNKGDEYYVRHWKLYVNIEIFIAKNIKALNDDVVRDALLSPLAVRGFKKLQVFDAKACGYLSMTTVQLLVEHCDILDYIGEMRYWQGVSIIDVALFKRYSKERNIAVELQFGS